MNEDPNSPERKAFREGFLKGMYSNPNEVPKTIEELYELNPYGKDDPRREPWNEGFCENFK